MGTNRWPVSLLTFPDLRKTAAVQFCTQVLDNFTTFMENARLILYKKIHSLYIIQIIKYNANIFPVLVWFQSPIKK